MVSRSYRLTIDVGHAPCPFDNIEKLISVTNENCYELGSKILTLATCARNIRFTAKIGGYIFGIAGAEFNEKANNLLWAGRVSEIISKAEYSEKFPGRPDNYYKLENGKYIQLKNPFHDSSQIYSDLNPPNVLLFDEWWYFGSRANEAVQEELRAKRQEAKILNEDSVKKFVELLKEKYPSNIVLGKPASLDQSFIAHLKSFHNKKAIFKNNLSCRI